MMVATPNPKINAHIRIVKQSEFVPRKQRKNTRSVYARRLLNEEDLVMASINDWAAKAAQRIVDEHDPLRRGLDPPGPERIAAIIATFAEPLMKLLRESKREHDHFPDGDIRDGTCCPRCCCASWPNDPEADFEPEPNSDDPCSCGADAWNAKVDAALAGESRRTWGDEQARDAINKMSAITPSNDKT